MIIRISGGSSGISNYLAYGQKSGREYNRDEIDLRVQLSGDLQQLDNVLAAFDPNNHHEKYMHITLSFKEPFVPENTLRSINEKFKAFIFTACHEEEFYYYSEAHLPKIKTLSDKAGQAYERFPHIHVVVPEYNLITGKKDNPLGKIDNIRHYIDAFQEQINQEYRLASPKDNLRVVSGGREAIINRHKLRPEMKRQEIKQHVAQIIHEDKSIRSVKDLAVTLNSIAGVAEVIVRDSAKFGGQYINLRFSEGKRAINLKDPIFLNNYLANKNTKMIADHEQRCKKHKEVLAKWTIKAKEIRFVDRASRKVREYYQILNADEKHHFLLNAQEKHELKLRTIIDDKSIFDHVQFEYYEHTPLHHHTVNHLEDTPHLDDLTHLEEMQHIDDIKHINDIIYDQTECEYDTRNYQGNTRHDLHDMQTRNSNRNSSSRESLFNANILSSNAIDDVERSEEVSTADVYKLRRKGNISYTTQQSREQQISKGSSNWTDKIQQIDLRCLLDHLTYQYRIDAQSISIVRNKHGKERISVENRQYSASDFMAKHLHLNWTEISAILNTVLEHQQRGGYRRAAVNSNLMWHRFQHQEASLPGLRGVHVRYKASRERILQETKYDYDRQLSYAQNGAKARLLKMQRQSELAEVRTTWLEEQRYYRLRPNERYLNFLHDEAANGMIAALRELNRVYPIYHHHRDMMFNNKKPSAVKNERFAPFDLGFNVQITKSGQVEYTNDKGEIAIIDDRQSVRVKIRNVETIAKALELAKARFGVDGFEIRNAAKSDQKAIEEAVEKTHTKINVLPNMKGYSGIERG